MGDFSLIETLGWDAQSGFRRLANHLKRLRGSAETLGFAFDEKKIFSEMKAKVDAYHEKNSLRVRLELSRHGDCQIQAVPFGQIHTSTVYRIGIANVRLQSADPLLRHKTTERAIYSAARSEFSQFDVDEVILCNEKDQVCEGTITNLFIRTEPGALLLTPDTTCGLLPGVLRGALLDAREAQQAIITIEQMKNAHEIFVGNSLRGLIRAKLVA